MIDVTFPHDASHREPVARDRNAGPAITPAKAGGQINVTR